MNYCLKTLSYIGGEKKVVCGNFSYNFSLIRRKSRNCVLFKAKGNGTIAEWSACAPTTRVVVRSCLPKVRGPLA
jgi:hypothetical protein